MNRLGFALLTLGGVLAFLGWHYRQDLFAAEGFLLLICLTLLASAWPTVISYKPDVEARPMGTGARYLWGAYYFFAAAMFFSGVAHTQAGGDGVWVAVTGAALIASLVVYDAFHVERFRAWRHEHLRSMGAATDR